MNDSLLAFTMKDEMVIKYVCFLFFSSQNNSVSPSESLRTASEKHRSSSDYSLDSKKRKVEEKDSMSRYVSHRGRDNGGPPLTNSNHHSFVMSGKYGYTSHNYTTGSSLSCRDQDNKVKTSPVSVR